VAISFVQFVHPVTIGQQGRESWSAKQEASHSSAHGKTTCVDKNNHLLFTYEAGTVKQRIKVPLTNIAFVTEMDEEPK
jgi:hypothetical protein